MGHRGRIIAQVGWLQGLLALAVWTGLGLAPAPVQAQGAARLSLPTATGHRGARVEVPLQLSALAGRPLAAGEIQLRFDGNVIAFEEVVTTGTLSAGWLVEYHLQVAGASQTLRIGIAGLQSATADGDLLRLAFRIPAAAPFGGFSPLELVAARLEQDPAGALLAVQSSHGLVRVGAPPVLWVNAGLALDEGAAAPISADQLAVRDVDNPPAELVYALVSAPAAGTLSGPQGPLGQGQTFTQADIDQGALSYAHDGSETTADAFAFSVSDGQGQPLAGLFAIQVTPVNDPPVLLPVGALQVDEGQVLEVTVSASDPDDTPVLTVQGLPPFATFADRGDGTGLLRIAPGFNAAGVYTGIVRATDQAGLADSETLTLSVIDVNRPPVADAGADIRLPYVAVAATPVALDGTGSSDPEGQPLTYAWSENGTVLATGPTPTVNLALGTHRLALVVNDGVFASPPDEVVVQIVDGTPPVLTLLGDNPVVLELGTPYVDPGAAALDEVAGNLSGTISITGAVDVETEGTYARTYRVSDPAGNAAPPQTRAVQVVVTPNSYSLIATNSLEIRSRARVNAGFVGVVDFGQEPLIGGRAELVVGTQARTAESVRVSSPRVWLRNLAAIEGTLVYTEWVEPIRTVIVGEEVQVGEDYWPLFAGFGLPAFETGTPNNERIDVRSYRTQTLGPGSYGTVQVRSRGTLVLSGGAYDMRRVEIGAQARVLVQAPTAVRVEERFNMGERSFFGPAGDDLDPADIRVYVNGTEQRGRGDDDDDEGDRVALAADVGQRGTFAGNLYAPHGTIHLRERSAVLGSLIARDLIVGTDVQVSLRSGWRTPGVQYQPGPPPPLAKPAVPAVALDEESGEGALANFPNPFNPATTLRYALPISGPVKLTIYSALGQEVQVLVRDTQPAGIYAVEWDGRDEQGQAVASGVYLAELRTQQIRQVRKLLLMR
jgi:hypothetical protein